MSSSRVRATAPACHDDYEYEYFKWYHLFIIFIVLTAELITIVSLVQRDSNLSILCVLFMLFPLLSLHWFIHMSFGWFFVSCLCLPLIFSRRRHRLSFLHTLSLYLYFALALSLFFTARERIAYALMLKTHRFAKYTAKANKTQTCLANHEK